MAGTKKVCERPIHKDVEFMVEGGRGGSEDYFPTFNAAAGEAVQRAISNGETVNLDVLISSKAGAKAYGGDDAVEAYEEDPDASVFERFEISVNAAGRVP